jgi:hypothetical protein
MKDERITICINTNIYNLSNYGYDCSVYEFFTRPERIEISISSSFSGQYVYRNIKVFDRSQNSTKLHEFRRGCRYHFTDNDNKSKTIINRKQHGNSK